MTILPLDLPKSPTRSGRRARCGQSQPSVQTPELLLTYYLDRMSYQSFEPSEIGALRAYLTSTGPWTGSPGQVTFKGASLAHLNGASRQYQFV